MSKENGKDVAGRIYDVKDYKMKDETGIGLAITHEQVNDDYIEGTIDGKMENVTEEDNSLLNRKQNKE